MWTAYMAIGDSVSEGVGDDVGDVRCRSWTDWVALGALAARFDLPDMPALS
jgi:hypothetical protein